MTESRRVFLAHAREDKDRVRALYKQLKQRGFNPWIDEEDLIPGQTWAIEIQKVIREAGAFIACLSQISVQKQGHVQIEFRLALTAYGERPPGAIYFVPVRLDECEIPDLQIPNRGLSIRDFHWLDLWQEGGFDRLTRALEKGLGTGGAMLKPGAEEGAAEVPSRQSIQYETCEIDCVTLRRDSYSFIDQSFNREMQFVANALGPRGQYSAGQSATFVDTKPNWRHKSIWQDFIHKLQSEGWEIIELAPDETWKELFGFAKPRWYRYKFRRPVK